jgi:hypothetical protein
VDQSSTSKEHFQQCYQRWKAVVVADWAFENGSVLMSESISEPLTFPDFVAPMVEDANKDAA